MRRSRRVGAWLLLVAALGLAALGQHYFLHRRDYLWDGLIFFTTAAACFLLAWRVAGGTARTAPARRASMPWVAWLRARAAQAILLALGLFLCLVATLLSAGRGLDATMGDAILPWLLGMTAVGAAAAWPPRASQAADGPADETVPEAEGGMGVPIRRRLAQVSRAGWLEAAGIAGLTLLALGLRLAALDRIPFTVGGDEAWHGLLARQVLQGELRNPFHMGYMSMPTAFYWPLSWAMWLMGSNVVGLRLPAALVGAATVPLLYLFVRDLWSEPLHLGGRRTALIAAAFLAGYDYHVHYSRLGANNVWDPLFVLVVMWAVARGLAAARDRDAEKWFLAGGLVMGLSVYFYTGARLLPLLVGAYAGFVWLQGVFGAAHAPTGRRIGAGLALLFLAFVIAAGPMLSFAASHPDDWNARINQVGILQSGWLEREPGLTGRTTAAILAEQFLRAAGAFHVFADRTVWYGAERPLLGFLPGILALLGMAWAAAHWRQRRYFLLLTWFWSVVITGGMLTESPPSSQRLVIAIPAVAVLVAVGLEQTVRLARRVLVFDRRGADTILALVTVALVAASVRFYFVEFTPERRYGSWNGETATRIGHYLRHVDGDYQVYLLGAPDIYWSFGTMTFLAPQFSGHDIVEPLDGPPTGVDESQNALFILLPHRAGELPYLQAAFPSGIVEEFHDEKERLRFVTYSVEF
ncbi:MAG: glycosyltransferase family 39 protein [Anaerolineae bacterium]|nr:glycosyltransferase family 39 protein [Anaerolineae bacterium]